MSFDPGLASSGVPSTRAPYQSGSAGIRQSLEAMALKMREGRLDPAVSGWAGKVLLDAGLDGRDRSTTDAKRCAALLDAFRSQVVYAPDAYGAEVVQSASATLCLRPGLCLNRGDCDDGTVALGSATLSLGIPTQVVKQNFGGGAQEHVLLAVYADGDWRYMDPSTNLPFGSAFPAADELWVDPMDPIGTIPEAPAEIVTLGKPAGAMTRKAPAPNPPHWPTGVGAILGYPTIQDLVALMNSAAYNLQQIQANLAACGASDGGFKDATEWASWQADLTKLQADFNTTTIYVNAYIGDQPQALWPVSVVFYPWDMARAIVDREIDLDRRWRQFSSCTAPTYPNEPQPTIDPDLWALQTADTALKNVKAAADKATQPVVIGTVGVAAGIALTLAGFFLLDRLIPARR